MDKREQTNSTKLMKEIEQLRESASKDTLTGLLNRGTSEKYIKNKLLGMNPGDRCALFILDLDKFKNVNDTLGHQAGDKVLLQVAGILSGLFRASDIVGRLGGDEFVIFLYGDLNEEVVKSKGRLLCEKIQIVIGDEQRIAVTASVGICTAEGAGQTFEEMYRQADLAMYEAKRNGRQRFYIREASLGQTWEADQQMESNPIMLDQILEYIDGGVALLQPEDPFPFIYISPGLRRMTGDDRAQNANGKKAQPLEMDKEGFLGVVYWEDKPVFERIAKKVQPGDEVNQSIRIRNGEGGYTWCRIRAEVVKYGDLGDAIMVSLTDISELKEKEKRLKEQNERLRAAFDQTGQGIWEVDLASGVFSLHSEGKKGVPATEDSSFPEGLISSGWIHKDCALLFREFAKEMFDGNVKGYGNFALRYPDDSIYNWASMSYNTLFDDDGCAVRVVGIIENFSEAMQGTQASVRKKKSVPESLLPYLIIHVECNITKNTIKEVWSEGKYQTGNINWTSYDDMVEKAKKNVFSNEDKKKFLERFGAEGLKKAYQEGRRWRDMEYRRVDGSGNIQWVVYFVSLYEDRETGDLCMFSFIALSEKRHRWEAEFGGKIVRDPVTNLYNRNTAKLMSEFLIDHQLSGGYGMAMIHLRGFSDLYDEDLEEKRFGLSALLNTALGLTCIMGQYSRDKLIVFFPEMASEQKLRELLKRAFNYVREMLREVYPHSRVYFIAGAVWLPAGEIGYDSMAREVVRLCVRGEKSPVDVISFPEDARGGSWDEMQGEEGRNQVNIPSSELKRPLTEKEKDVAIRCMSGMLLSDTLEASTQSVLSCLGNYYSADRVYILTLSENKHMVTMPCEWVEAGRHSIQQALSGTLVDRVPILRKCIAQRVPIFLSRKQKGEGEEEKTWCFMIYPIISEHGKLNSFLCIENAKERMTESALPAMLLPYILKEKERYHGRGKPGYGASSWVGEDVPNLKAYMESIYSFTSETYCSLGAVCVDIPELSSMNGSYGFEYGRGLLWFVCRTMGNIFGKSHLFRTWDTEFVALCPNTTQQVLLGRCNRLRAVVQGKYPDKVRIGYTWADGVFAGKELVEQAREIMRCETLPANAIHPNRMAQKTIYRTVGEAIKAGRFTVYFQPKVDLTTGETVGAEALVRGVDTEGTIISPAHFVEELEKSGGIRDLDLFVLDKVLFLLDLWKGQGMELLPVSVNFSRVTLFDPNVLASVLAIQSRYPGLEDSPVEIELTESAGDVGKNVLQNEMDKFRQFGIRFALDDFGSKYSNLSIFTNVKFDTVKLDRGLVSELPENEMSQELVRNIAGICERGGMRCVAEGVETKEQIDALVQAGCTCAQGFYYDRPLSSEKFRKKYLHRKEQE